MRVVLDTNVVVSGLLFGAVPGRILTAWTAGEFTLVVSPPVLARVSADPDDDKFLAVAVAGAAGYVVSGDKHLLAVGGWHGIRVLKPRALLGPARIAAPLTPVAADRRGRPVDAVRSSPRQYRRRLQAAS